jgi:inosine-uridine nucleoside N-ribohydrolase
MYRGYQPGSAPEPEWNIKSNVEAAKIVFASGVPLYVAPLDSTIDLKLDAKRREQIFAVGTAFNDALAALDFIWINTKNWNADAPTLFDVLAVQLVGEKAPCPLTPLHVEVDEVGVTQVVPDAAPNANVALKCDSSAVLDEFVRLLESK